LFFDLTVKDDDQPLSDMRRSNKRNNEDSNTGLNPHKRRKYNNVEENEPNENDHIDIIDENDNREDQMDHKLKCMTKAQLIKTIKIKIDDKIIENVEFDKLLKDLQEKGYFYKAKKK